MKRRTVQLFATSAVFSLAFVFGCGDTSGTKSAVTEPDVYTAGYIVESVSAAGGSVASLAPRFTNKTRGVDRITAVKQGNPKAAYWKNGSIIVLTDGTVSCYANGIAVSGTDVYIGGEVDTETGAVTAGFWKNGTQTILPSSGEAAVNSVAIAPNGDVYAVGYDADEYDACHATLWINGVESYLTDSTLPRSEAYQVVFSGNDCYIAGVVSSEYEWKKGQAVYWKNGTINYLTTDAADAGAYAIYVSGNDVYAAGYSHDGVTSYGKAAYWKNGSITFLTDGSDYQVINGIALNGTDICAAGCDGYVAEYWNNGVATAFSDGTDYADATGIAVSGSNVYVTGYDKDAAKYWKNGTAVDMSVTAATIKSRVSGITLY
jgi:hypothetical protein